MNDRDYLAAEYALRLLEGEELLEARRLETSDREFAREVRRWEAWLAPFLDAITPVQPSDALWQRIAQVISLRENGADILHWRRKVRTWQGVAAMFAAAAAVIGLVTLPSMLRPPVPPVPTGRPAPTVTPVQPAPSAPAPQPEAPLLVAALAVEGSPGAIAVTYVPVRRDLLVSAAALSATADQDHQLWIIPEGGTPISLGLVSGGEMLTQTLSAELAEQFRPGASIALSVEPSGGSPTGQPTGPVVATGRLREG